MNNNNKNIIIAILLLLVILLAFIQFYPKLKSILKPTTVPPVSQEQTITPTSEPTIKPTPETEEELEKLINADQDQEYQEELKNIETETQE